MRGIRFMGFVLLASASAFCQIYGAAWTKSGVVTIGTAADWANYTGAAVANFPLLVKLDASVFTFAEAKAGGADIRFASADGATALPYEIESWDATKGKASIWVKVPSVAANATATIKMYWGNAAAASESNGAAVFPPASGYVGVWHLSDAASSATNADATGSGNAGAKLKFNDAAAEPAGPTDIPLVDSPLGTGQAYNMTPDLFTATRVPADKVDLKNKSMTVSGWYKRKETDHSGDFFVMQGTQDPNLGMRLGIDSFNKAMFGFDGGLETSTTDARSGIIQSLDWHFWVGTYNTADKKLILYKDGVQDATQTSDANFTGSGTVDFGWGYGPSGEYFHPQGAVDEVRIMSNVQTADAVKLTYLNQKPNQALVSYPVPTGCTDNFAINPPPASIQEGAALTLTANVKCAQRIQWYKVEGTTETPVASDGANLAVNTRVKGAGGLKYRIKGLFNGAWKTADAALNIPDQIPEPELALSVPSYFFSGAGEPLRLGGIVTNKAAVEGSPAATINYVWTTSGPAAHFTLKPTADSLVIYFQTSTGTATEGNLTVKLCVDNGGPASCKEGVVGASLPVRPQQKLDGRAFALNGSSLTWLADAEIRVWDVRGKLVFHRSGKKGSAPVALTAAELKALSSRENVMKAAPAAAGNLNK